MPHQHPSQDPREQREHPRTPVARAAKVFHRASGRYVPAQTCNVSRGGVLLRVGSARPFRPDDRVDVFIAWSDGVLLAASGAIRATVTRAARSPSCEQFVALRFETPAALPAADAA